MSASIIGSRSNRISAYLSTVMSSSSIDNLSRLSMAEIILVGFLHRNPIPPTSSDSRPPPIAALDPIYLTQMGHVLSEAMLAVEVARQRILVLRECSNPSIFTILSSRLTPGQ